jgi:hypothetical protein
MTASRRAKPIDNPVVHGHDNKPAAIAAYAHLPPRCQQSRERKFSSAGEVYHGNSVHLLDSADDEVGT